MSAGVAKRYFVALAVFTRSNRRDTSKMSFEPERQQLYNWHYLKGLPIRARWWPEKERD